MTDLAEWFQERHKWLQDAARRLLQNSDITDADIDELTLLCKSEVPDAPTASGSLTAQPIPSGAFGSASPATLLRLDAMDEITGINALAPRNPLIFGRTEPLTVVFGSNGSGKSGYMRLLKNICGARTKKPLHGNVFETASADQRCTIRYTTNGTQCEAKWNPAVGVHSELRGVAIYDTDCANVYIGTEHEVTYEPFLLSVIRRLVDVSTEVEKKITTEIATKVAAKPAISTDFAATAGGAWYGSLSRNSTQADIDARCAWTAEQNSELIALVQRLSEPDPAVKAKALQKTKNHLTVLIELARAIEANLTDDAFNVLCTAIKVAADKRLAADDGAKKVFSGAPLEGVASKSWRLLWEQARNYSESAAYTTTPFPNVAAEARCVLCQQPLDQESGNRLRTFEEFVKGNLEREAAEAEAALDVLRRAQISFPNTTDLDQKLDLAGIAEESLRQIVRSYFEDLAKRQETFSVATELAQLAVMPDKTVLDSLFELDASLEIQAKVFDEDAKSNCRGEIQQKIRELNARKWLFDQKAAVEIEIGRLKSVHLLEQAKKLTNTTVLSTKASSLADELVTTAFQKRFEDELKALGARRIRVEIKKMRAAKGQIWHQINLIASKTAIKTMDVLSEGEFRIVSIAAFLADMAADGGGSPFVFDDPISSLDLDFEERTAERLIELSKSRQVIVFTHRLSLLASLEEVSKKAGVAIRITSLMRESWGAGEPGEHPMYAQNPKTALNTLKDQRLLRAKKILDEQGFAAYTVEVQALCSDIRKTIERLIEKELLADVVQRFRRPITTMGKMPKLAKINTADCTFIDGMMTKYSYHEHSQPSEAPVSLPEPAELEEDLAKLKGWLEEFTTRAVPS